MWRTPPVQQRMNLPEFMEKQQISSSTSVSVDRLLSAIGLFIITCTLKRVLPAAYPLLRLRAEEALNSTRLALKVTWISKSEIASSSAVHWHSYWLFASKNSLNEFLGN